MIDWQTPAALAIVAIAIALIMFRGPLTRLLARRRKAAGCCANERPQGGCH